MQTVRSSWLPFIDRVSVGDMVFLKCSKKICVFLRFLKVKKDHLSNQLYTRKRKSGMIALKRLERNIEKE